MEMIKLLFDGGEAGSDYGYFIETVGEGPGEQDTIGPTATTAAAWEALGYTADDAVEELVMLGYSRDQIENA